jgi:predicted alpha/beta hydrolase family esterase
MKHPIEYIFLAGIGNSEREHWQTLWYESLRPHAHWVEHRDWDAPRAAEWLSDLDRLLATTAGTKVLVCHSLGCVVAAEWLSRNSNPTCTAAFLVSLPDTRGPNFPKSAVGFPELSTVTPRGRLCLVMSEDDPYASPSVAIAAAERWRARLVDVGPKGHINLESALGDWSEGRKLLDDFTASL